MSRLGSKLFDLKRTLNHSNQIDNEEIPACNTTSLINNLQQIVFQIGTTGKLEFLNTTWEVLTEYPVSTTLGKYFIDYVHPKDKAKAEEYLQKLCSKNKQLDYSENIRILSKSDNPKWVVLRATAIDHDTDNKVIGITGTLTEVTEKIRQQELHEAKYRNLQNLLNTNPGMVYRCRNDENLTIEYVNEACINVTGYRPKQFLNNDQLTFLNIIHLEDQKRILSTIQNNLREDEEYEIHHRILTSSNSIQWVLNKGKGIFSSSGELLSFEGILVDYDKQNEEFVDIKEQLLYDPATGLISIDLFINRLEHAIQKTKSREDYVFSILLLNIDQYSQLLKNIGIENCEIVCTELSHRIIELLGPSNSVCKFQADQLGILLDSSKYSIKDITALLSQIQAQVQAPLSVAENEIYVTASTGVVIGDSKYSDKDKVLSELQDAVNRAKSLGGARYELSDLVTHGKAALQTHIESELALALRKDKLLVYWQPIINLKTDKLSGLEARIVWPHPLRGLLFAEQFVPNAEETQLITPLWEWMLNDTSRQIEHWKSSVHELENIAISIQITGATLLDTDAILRLREKLLKVKPDSCNLVVGVSENVLVHAPNTTESMLKPTQGKDIQLLLDNYGSDKTSLTLLNNMSIDLLRLDRNLTKTCLKDKGKLIKAISSLAHELNIFTIANDVKTEEQLNILKTANVDFAQGEIISKPIDENEVINILNKLSRS